MTKTYLISEEVLREVLDALEATQPYLHPSCTAQRLVDITENRIGNILASPPAEPVAVLMRNETFHDMQSLHWTPQTHWHETWKAHDLYRKDL